MTMPQAVFQITRDGELPVDLPVHGDGWMGRAEDCAVRLNDRAVSRQHAYLRLINSQVQVENRSEFASMKVNGADVTSAVLKVGDLIEIGPYRVKLAASHADRTLTPPEGEPRLPVSRANEPERIEATEMAIEPAELPAPQELSFQPAVELSSSSQESLVDLSPDLDPVQAAALERPEELSNRQSAQELDLAALGGHDDAGPVVLDQGDGAAVGATAVLEGESLSEPKLIDEPKLELAEVEVPNFEMPSHGVSLDQGPEPIDISQQVELAEPDAKTKPFQNGAVKVRLIFAPGTASVTEFVLGKTEVTLGRDEGLSITVHDKKVSRKHATIFRRGVRVYIRDLDSANGTYVNESRISGEHELSGEDRIRVGHTEFALKAEDEQYKAREPGFMKVPVLVKGAGMPATNNREPFAPSTTGLPQMMGVPRNVALQGIEGSYGHAMASGTRPDLGMPPMPAAPGIEGIPGFSPTLEPLAGVKPGKRSLLQKFRELPPTRKLIWSVVLLAGVYLLLDEDEAPVVQPKKPPVAQASPGVTTSGGALTFNSLSPEQKKFVEAQHDLAYQYYKNKEYDQAIFEVRKIFPLIATYKDSREIEQYAIDAKRKLDALKEEKAQAANAEIQKRHVAELRDEIQKKMDHKQYEQAQALFSDLLAIDPENPEVPKWKAQIQSYLDQIAEQRHQLELKTELTRQANVLLKRAGALQSAEKYRQAIAEYRWVLALHAIDSSTRGRATAGIEACREAIKNALEPLLAEAKQNEEGGLFAEAFARYSKAHAVDPDSRDPSDGMNRTRKILHDRAKGTYTEAVLAESYSDFSTAKKKFKETLDTAPIDDVYHERAARKLARWLGKLDNLVSQ